MSYKALELSAELADELSKRTSLIRTDSFDSNGDPVITLAADATPAAGEKVIVIRTKAIDWPLAKDVLGLPSTVFTPHVIQVCTELGASAAAEAAVTPAELLPVLITIGKRGTRVEWYQSANGVLPATAQMTSANLKSAHEAELYWGMKASQ